MPVNRFYSFDLLANLIAFIRIFLHLVISRQALLTILLRSRTWSEVSAPGSSRHSIESQRFVEEREKSRSQHI